MRRLIVLVFFLSLSPIVTADEGFLLKPGERVVFLGDSNTFSGRFIMLLDAYVTTRFPNDRFDLINLGLPSETVTGLSEPDHPYPRPDIHSRVAQALQKTKPNVVVICYGMNDGIYYPFSDERFRKYQAGLRSLIQKCRDAKTRVVLHTPAPFDSTPLATKVLPATADKFSWMRPYADYDGVLTRYSEWLVKLRDEGLPVADPHAAILEYLKLRRKDQPAYRVSGDGIHPDGTGQWFIARELLTALHAPTALDEINIDLKSDQRTEEIRKRLTVNGDSISYRCAVPIPMPQDSTWDKVMLQSEKIDEKWNRWILRVKGVETDRFNLFVGDQKAGQYTREQLTSGVDLFSVFQATTQEKRSRIWQLIEKKQRLLGLAWLSDVGHNRPDTPKGIPLAEAQRQAADLEVEIRKLAAPTESMLKLVPAR
jgi:lysophospholipase L1-like esterase